MTIAKYIVDLLKEYGKTMWQMEQISMVCSEVQTEAYRSTMTGLMRSQRGISSLSGNRPYHHPREWKLMSFWKN